MAKLSNALAVANKIDKYTKSTIKGIVSVNTSSVFNKARKDKIKRSYINEYPFAQYSAIMDKDTLELDSKVCSLCRILDGQIIRTIDVRFLRGDFDPPQHKY